MPQVGLQTNPPERKIRRNGRKKEMTKRFKFIIGGREQANKSNNLFHVTTFPSLLYFPPFLSFSFLFFLILKLKKLKNLTSHSSNQSTVLHILSRKKKKKKLHCQNDTNTPLDNPI